ncbi:DUF1361 domain-containing protein [Candidatus Enterococcus ikei]|uniref:DUF1361 domain-containing protein n=1 Tax=Candidatus Enterococcus ikei TaxID=2815326 RepID=A0ABS3GX27_9ENTE|nr:DUF1361 domain-containing protein [Enterococcus sp. DIV0869a]MBO0439750.1 DUF1361 domain-containing protein [Enterococcus sp. DIV0869a]
MIFFADSYHFMALNVFLAYLPIEISFHFQKVTKNWFLLLGILWLLFYPNAPYLFTDFFHLETLTIYQGMDQLFGQSLSDWLSFSLLTVGICFYGFVGMATIFSTLHECYRRSIFNKKWQGGLFVLIVNLLSSLAIFVGRFDRLHSIHLFTKPLKTITIIFLNWSVNKVLFILLFTGLQLLLLLAIICVKKSDMLNKEEKLC